MIIYIYGNVVLYAEDDRKCKDDDTFKKLWNCSLIVVIYGYFYMIYAIGFILFFVGVFVLYRAWSLDNSS